MSRIVAAAEAPEFQENCAAPRDDKGFGIRKLRLGETRETYSKSLASKSPLPSREAKTCPRLLIEGRPETGTENS